MRGTICCRMNVSRASGAACGSSYGCFCIFMAHIAHLFATSYGWNRFWASVPRGLPVPRLCPNLFLTPVSFDDRFSLTKVSNFLGFSWRFKRGERKDTQGVPKIGGAPKIARAPSVGLHNDFTIVFLFFSRNPIFPSQRYLCRPKNNRESLFPK